MSVTEREDFYAKKSLTSLTKEEKAIIKALNFVASHDGIIQSEGEIKYILQQGIEKLIAKKRQHLVSITQTSYPIRIKY